MSGWRIVPDKPVAWVIEGTMLGDEKLTHYDDSLVGAECGFDGLEMESIGRPAPLYAAAPEPDWEAIGTEVNKLYWNSPETNANLAMAAALKAIFGSKP